MKKLLLIVIFTPFINLLGQTKQDTSKSEIQKSIQYESIIEEPPSFAGGQEALQKFMNDKLIVPAKVKEKKLKGKTFLKLGIHNDGTAVVLEVLKKMDECIECDQAAIEMIKLMPKWTPAKKDGKNVAAPFNLPVEFSYKK
jgi:protein TonB